MSPKEVIARADVEFLHGVPVHPNERGAEAIIDALETAGYLIVSQQVLKPFAEIGEKFRYACSIGAFPAGASARFMKLEPLVAQNFVDLAEALRTPALTQPTDGIA